MNADVSEAISLPCRYQCPVCLDLLSFPVQLPCCKKHICLVCFERTIQVTSTDCAFCRKRIVGFARRETNKVDESLWEEIQKKTIGMTSFHFENEIQRLQNRAKPGELQSYYEKCKEELEHERMDREHKALEATLKLLETEKKSKSTVIPYIKSTTAYQNDPPKVYDIFTGKKCPSIARKSVSKKLKRSSQVPMKKKSWTCSSCTYINWSHLTNCAMCMTKSIH